MRTVNWVGCILVAGLGGCSFYPIPDDVGYSKTEEIVRYARCEMRSAVIYYMLSQGLIDLPATPERIAAQIAAARGKLKTAPKSLTPVQKELLLKLAKVAVVYAFDFDIKEHNNTGASAGFKLPWMTSNVLDAGASASLDLTRQGHRVFTSEDSWDELLANPKRCLGVFEQPENPGNFVYPLTGSIGVGRVVKTFIDIEQQGGAKDSFVDTLTFTTEASGGADAALKLEPVPNQFRPVAATAAISASRLDIHKLTLSLVFPVLDPPKGGIDGVVRVDGDLNAPFLRPAPWRARYNLCVQDARNRENTFKQLRLTDPIVYCITYADEFAPQYGRQPTRAIAVTLTQGAGVSPGPGGAGPGARGRTSAEPEPRARTGAEPEPRERIQGRPNRPIGVPPF
ncbi:hypothetical protein [Bradyrhizobium liaoningense]|uniref:hypothetical protein n=1 Tax=Bradyrhizobium liaoningense TaxID=43992 RepID=UPI001BA56114|nr:hypothetical protein [Bradyrhizobium liaoningense]MBR1034467.1 hypothetical protein [Bradyrhizobium liaoningense]